MEVNKRLSIAVVMLGSAFGTLLLANILTNQDVVSQTKNIAYNFIHLEGNPTSYVQCPIPMSDRVRNQTKNQCVFASIETLGNWGSEPKLKGLTKLPECQGLTDPLHTGLVLNKLGVHYKQSVNDTQKGRKLIKESLKEGRGIMFGVEHNDQEDNHAMVMIHYDEEKVLYIDNSDPKMRTKEMSASKFEEIWDRWVLVIYPDKDPFPNKAAQMCGLRLIAIRDHSGTQQDFPPDYIPIPRIN